MPQHQSRRRRGASAYHVLVAATDVGRDRLDDDAVIDLLSLRRLQYRVVDALYFDFARPEINHSVIGSHEIFSFAALLCESKLASYFSQESCGSRSLADCQFSSDFSPSLQLTRREK